MMTARGTDATLVVTSKRDLNQSVSCLIGALNKAFATTNPLANSITHQAVIIEPGKVMEIAPQQVITVGAEVYFVRLTAISANSTRLELFSSGSFTTMARDPVTSCS